MLFSELFLVFFEYLSKSDLITGGETEDEKVRVDIMENQAMDFRNGFVRLCYTDFVSTLLKVFNGMGCVILCLCITTNANITCLTSGQAEARIPWDAAGCTEAVLRFLGKQEMVCRWQGMSPLRHGRLYVLVILKFALIIMAILGSEHHTLPCEVDMVNTLADNCLLTHQGNMMQY